MKGFEIPTGTTTDAFIEKVKATLSGRSIGQLLTIKKDGAGLLVTISKMGTTELRYSLSEAADGKTTALLQKESIAFAHKMFKKDFEEKLAHILTSLGAKVLA